MPEETILLVDDADDVRAVTAFQLEEAGFRVKEAATGEQALALAAHQPDLIILDVHLPDIDGFEVCRRLRAQPLTAAIPILHLSAAYRGLDDRVRGLEGGADAYLTHPVEPEELLATARALLRIHRAESELRRSERRAEALRTVASLAHAAAHEINNPLTVIVGSLGLIERHPALDPDVRRQVSRALQAVEDIQGILRRLARISRLETSETSPHVPQMLDLVRSSEEDDGSGTR